MSITYPSEVLPEVDWENPVLATKNVSSFQYDDGTVVTNLITGEVGEVFDTANQYGVDSPIGQRISIVFNSGLSPSEVELLNNDIFGTLKTRQDVADEYQLIKPLSTGTDGYLEIVDTTNNSKDFLIEFKCAIVADNGIYPSAQVIGATSSSSYHIYITSGTLKFGYQWQAKSFTLNTALPTGKSDVHTYSIKLKNGVLSAYQDGVKLAEEYTGVTQGFKLYDGKLFLDNEGYEIHYFKYISSDFPSDTRYWEFNQRTGTQVVDHYNGAIATLVNFPAESGYVFENDEIVGYKVDKNDTALTNFTNWQPTRQRYSIYFTVIPNMGGYSFAPYADTQSRGLDIRANRISYSVGYMAEHRTYPTPLVEGSQHKATIEVDDNTKIVKLFIDDIQIGSDIDSSGKNLIPEPTIRLFSRNHINSGLATQQWSKVVFEDMDNVLETITLDLTTGDTSKFPSLTGAGSAIIHSDKVGWQPITPVDIWTVGTGRDFTLLSDFFTTIKNYDNAQRAVIYESDSGTSTIYANGSCPRYELQAASGLEFTGKTPPPINYMNRRIYSYNTYTSVRGIGINLFNGCGMDADNCYVQLDVHGGIYADNSLGWKVSNSVVYDAFWNDSVSVDISFTNCIFETGRTSTIASSSPNNIVLSLVNCVLPTGANVNSENVPAYANAGTKTYISNNVFESSNRISIYTDLGGNIDGQNMTGWFDTDSNLTDTAQTVLKGQGFNGSDIASWAYAINTPIEPTNYKTFWSQNCYEVISNA